MAVSLGPPIRKEPEPRPEWAPVPGKPYFFVNAAGQLKYVPPPLPAAPTLADLAIDVWILEGGAFYLEVRKTEAPEGAPGRPPYNLGDLAG